MKNNNNESSDNSFRKELPYIIGELVSHMTEEEFMTFLDRLGQILEAPEEEDCNDLPESC